MKQPLDILKKYWKHSSFRYPQKEIIESVLQNKNVIALLPTGFGKSVCFQIPALIKPGICIVISPLIALMEDQVESLNNKGIKSIALNSRYGFKETVQAFDNLKYGNFKFLYLSPEKLQSEFIQEKLRELEVNLIAIDEAHCISQWGHDFRPAYLKISKLTELHPKVNIIALTASATEKVFNDIAHQLSIENAVKFKESFYRPNLEIDVVKSENIFDQLISTVRKIKEPIIVYTNTRKNTLIISNHLNSKGFKSVFFHGGLSYPKKMEHQLAWMKEKNQIMVATNAFGMGIDKNNVRAIIHISIPNSIENYVQEIGRAGRDGKKSYAKLIYNNNLIEENKLLIEKGIADKQFCKIVYQKLHENFQIGFGEFTENKFQFNLQEFCNKYTLPIVKVGSAIHHFKLENIIEINESYKKRSRIKFLVKDKYLLNYEKSNPKINSLLKVILRSYGGLFDQFVPINESVIAKKINQNKENYLNKNQIVNSLNQLKKDGVIQYFPADNFAEIKFLVPREDSFVLNQISRNIEQRNKVKITNLHKVTLFIQNNKVCRNVQISNYFNYSKLNKCGFCDVCKSEINSNKNINYISLSMQVLNLFKTNKTIELNNILNSLPFDKNYIIKSLHLLIEKKTIKLTSHNKFEKIEE